MPGKHALTGTMRALAEMGLTSDEKNVDDLVSKMQDNSNVPYTLIQIDPNEAEPWSFADRHEQELGDIKALAGSMKIRQEEPILVRPQKKEKNGIKYEIIFGRRRWLAAKSANLTLTAILSEMNDQQAALSQKSENEHRKDISDYSKAKHYKSLLDNKVFTSERELAKNLNISKTKFNNVMSFSRIPQPIMDAVSSPCNLSTRMAIKIASLATNKEVIASIILMIDKIESGNVTSVNIEQMLNKSLNKQTKVAEKKLEFEKSYFSKKKEKLFTFKTKSSGETQIKLSKNILNKVKPEDVFKCLSDFMEKEMD